MCIVVHGAFQVAHMCCHACCQGCRHVSLRVLPGCVSHKGVVLSMPLLMRPLLLAVGMQTDCCCKHSCSKAWSGAQAHAFMTFLSSSLGGIFSSGDIAAQLPGLQAGKGLLCCTARAAGLYLQACLCSSYGGVPLVCTAPHM